MNEYEKQANDFMEKTGTTIDVKFLYAGLYFEDDKEIRDIYEITLRRNNKRYTFKFGQSIVDSAEYIEKEIKKMRDKGKSLFEIKEKYPKVRNYPTAYDVLASVTKYDPGTFKDFCFEYGYSDDSIKAQKIYFAVQEEYQNINRLFGDVIEELAEIA